MLEIKRLILAFSFVFGLTVCSSAQIFEADLGANNKAPEYFTKYTRHLGKYDNHFYNIYMNGYGKVFLEKIDAEYNLVSNELMSKDLASSGGSSSGLFHVTLVKDKIKMFYEVTGKGKIQIMCKTFDLSGTELKSTKITSLPYSAMAQNDLSLFLAKESEHHQSIAIVAASRNKIKSTVSVQLTAVELNSLSVTKSITDTLELDYKFFVGINDLEISNEGVMATSISTTKHKDLKKTDYVYLLKDEKIIRKRLEFDEISYFYTDVLIKNNQLELAGCFLKTIDKKTKERGFYVGSLSVESFEFKVNDKLDFDNEYAQFLYNLDYNYSIEQLLNEGCYDTELVEIDEKRSYVLIEHKCSFVSKSRELVVLLTSNDKIIQKWLIPKYFVYNYGEGYGYALEGEVLRVVYNDNIDNLESENLKDSEKIYKIFDETASIMACEIKPNKAKAKEVLFKANSEGGQLIPLMTGSYEEGLFITLNKGKNRKYGMLKLK